MRKNLNGNHTFRFSVSENHVIEVSSSYLQKCGIFYFSQKTDQGCVFFFCFFFFKGDRIEPVVLECRKRDYSDGN